MATDILWTTEKRKVKDLIPADYNPRIITEKERTDLIASIEEYGAVEPIVINRDNKLIGGHQRTGIYADLGIEEIEVRVPNRQLTIEEEMRLNLRLNKNTGGWDSEKLQKLDLNMLLDVGFADEELSNMWDKLETSDDGHKHKEAIKKAKNTSIKPGDIYQLGDHRLMCGDATLRTDVEKVLGGERADMIYCDPPYNIGLDYSKGVGNTEDKYAGEYDSKADSKTNNEYADFLRVSLKNATVYAKKNCHVFYWCDERYVWLLQTLFAEGLIANKRVCLWIKNNASPTPGVAFNKCYEPCVYGTIGRPYLNPNYRAFNEIMNKEVGTGNQVADDILELLNIWMVKRDTTQDYDHPTQKPVQLHEKPLKRCSKPGAIVLDTFGGSGSTLIACEQLKRRAFLIEKDPVFCQVIVNRYEELTGQQAKKV